MVWDDDDNFETSNTPREPILLDPVLTFGLLSLVLWLAWGLLTYFEVI